MAEFHTLAETFAYLQTDRYHVTDQVWRETQDKAAPEGTVHHWSSGDHVKHNGKWEPVEAGIEQTMSTKGEKRKSLCKEYFNKHYKGRIPSTKTEIKTFINDIKATEYNPKGTDVLNRITKRGLEELKKVTGGKFNNVIFTNNKEIIRKGTAAEIIRGMPSTILINPDNEYWKDTKKRLEFVKNCTSTKSIYHVFFHEEGHEKAKAKKNIWDPGDRRIAIKTSILAAIQPEDFCAELYAKKRYIERYPDSGTITDDEIKLYEKYGGRYADL